MLRAASTTPDTKKILEDSSPPTKMDWTTKVAEMIEKGTLHGGSADLFKDLKTNEEIEGHPAFCLLPTLYETHIKAHAPKSKKQPPMTEEEKKKLIRDKQVAYLTNGCVSGDKMDGGKTFKKTYDWLDEDLVKTLNAKAKEIGYAVMTEEMKKLAVFKAKATKVITTKDGEKKTVSNHIYSHKRDESELVKDDKGNPLYVPITKKGKKEAEKYGVLPTPNSTKEGKWSFTKNGKDMDDTYAAIEFNKAGSFQCFIKPMVFDKEPAQMANMCNCSLTKNHKLGVDAAEIITDDEGNVSYKMTTVPSAPCLPCNRPIFKDGRCKKHADLATAIEWSPEQLHGWTPVQLTV